MKRYTYFAAVVAATFLMSDAVQARTWVYKPGRVHAVRRVVVAPIGPYWVPPTTTIVAPNVIIGPRGRVRYIAPVQPFINGVYVR